MWCVAQNDLWPSPISSRSLSDDYAIEMLKHVTSCRVRCCGTYNLDGFFLYLAQMIATMRACVACNGLWPWLISSRSFSREFAIRLLKYGTSCRVCSAACTVMDGFFHIGHKLSLAWEGVSCAMTFDLDLYLQCHSAMICNKTVKIWHILLCPLYSIKSPVWIHTLFGTNDH